MPAFEQTSLLSGFDLFLLIWGLILSLLVHSFVDLKTKEKQSREVRVVFANVCLNVWGCVALIMYRHQRGI